MMTWNCNRAAMHLSRELVMASIAVHLAGAVDRLDIPNKAVTEICAAARPMLFAGHGDEVASMLALERAQHDDAEPDAGVWNQVLDAVCMRLGIRPGASVPASCGDAVGTFDATKRTYGVDSVIPDTDGGCPMMRGFFPVEFVDEPDGVTRCLVQKS